MDPGFRRDDRKGYFTNYSAGLFIIYMQYIVAILLGILPLYLVRFAVFGIPANALEVALYGVFAFVLASALRKGSVCNLFSLPKEGLFRTGFVLLLLGAALSVAFNPTLRALGILKGWFLDPILFFLLMRYIRGSASSIAWAYGISATAVALIAFGYWARDISTYDGRLRAFFESPNHLAMFIAPAALITAWLTGQLLREISQMNRESGTRNQRIHIGTFVLHASCFIILALVLWLTKSHGAWFGVVGAFFVGFVFPKISQKLRVMVIVIVIVLGASTPLLAVRFWPQLQNTFSVSERSSLASRTMIWQSALAIGRDNPIFGVGPGTFQERYLAYQKNYPPYLEWAVPQPHNIYLAFWLQTGLLGLTGFLLLLVWYFKKLLNNLSLVVSCWLLVVMTYTLLHGSVDTLYWKNDLSFMFWALLGFVSLLRENEVSKDSS